MVRPDLRSFVYHALHILPFQCIIPWRMSTDKVVMLSLLFQAFGDAIKSDNKCLSSFASAGHLYWFCFSSHAIDPLIFVNGKACSASSDIFVGDLVGDLVGNGQEAHVIWHAEPESRV